jgi:hypothetical protein
MVVDDFDILWSSGGPDDTYPPLIIDPDTVLPRPVAFERLKTISGGHAQIVQLSRLIEQAKLAQRYVLDIRRQMAAPLATPYSRCLRIAEANDHPSITYNVMRHSANVDTGQPIGCRSRADGDSKSGRGAFAAVSRRR